MHASCQHNNRSCTDNLFPPKKDVISMRYFIYPLARVTGFNSSIPSLERHITMVTIEIETKQSRILSDTLKMWNEKYSCRNLLCSETIPITYNHHLFTDNIPCIQHCYQASVETMKGCHLKLPYPYITRRID